MAEASVVDAVAEETLAKYERRARAAENVAVCEREARQMAEHLLKGEAAAADAAAQQLAVATAAVDQPPARGTW